MAKKAKKKSSFIADFKAFITRGNVVDMAVGVIIGGAFGKIVSGLVTYILNPVIGLLMKEGKLDDFKTVLREAVLDAEGNVVTAESAILWGTWIQTIIDFVITALCIFLIIRMIAKLRNIADAKKIAEEEAKAAEAKAKAEAEKAEADAKAAELAAKQAALDASLLNQEKILAEIRDMMKNK